jgi:hypothetical protein
MICAQQFRECKRLTTHLLGHHAGDLQVLGMERFMLAKGQHEQIEEVSNSMRRIDPSFRTRSRASSFSKNSQATEPLEYMTLVSQPGCYGVILRHLCPSAQPVQPPFSQRQKRPHFSCIKHAGTWSYRIKEGYFETWRGLVHDIIYLSKLIGVRGNHPGYPSYRPVELQISQQDFAWVFKAEAPSQSLVEAVMGGRYDVLEEMCEQVSSMQQDAGLFYGAAYDPDAWV